MMAGIAFTTYLSDIDKEAYDELRKLEAERTKLIERVTNKFKDSERFRAAQDLAKIGNYGNKISPIIKFANYAFSVQVEADEIKPSAPYIAPLHIGEKTLNALLNGKILNDAEKRALISRVTNGAVCAKVEGDA